MKILMVSPYPPLRDGIANYAVQVVGRLMREGHDVHVISPGPSAAHEHLDLFGPKGGGALARRTPGYDRVVVQWHPVFHYADQRRTYRAQTDLALWAAFRRAKDVEVWVHEFEYEDVRLPGIRRSAAVRMWRSVDRIYVHSEAERKRFLAAMPVNPERVLIGPHGQSFVRRTTHDRRSARRSLGLPPSAFCVLSIGFVQRHKGFDRAVKAFAGLAEHGARLDIVGGIRLDEPDFVAYRDELTDLCRRVDGTHFAPGYVSDELFDRWLVASDLVVLPYREIWSSGVLERAALYGRPVIATKVGGLADQATGRDVVLVDDDTGLRDALWKAAGVPQPIDQEPVLAPAGEQGLWEQLQSEVLQRAAWSRGDLRGPVSVAPGPRVDADDGASSALEAADEARRRARDWSAPVRHLPSYTPPRATSVRPGVPALKRLIHRLIKWELDPIVAHLGALQNATARALEDAAHDVSRRDLPPRR
jgi:glycosyltransferase involved in cell wall biosynthesis